MCVLWMPANLLSSGIVDKNDKITFKKENKDILIDCETAKTTTEKEKPEEQADKN